MAQGKWIHGLDFPREKSEALQLQKYSALIKELFRYAIVGGIAFLVDFGVLCLFRESIFPPTQLGLYGATAMGFISGLAVNYILSLWFVFLSAKGTKKGRTVRDVLLFVIIGVIGLGLSEAGMYIGAVLLSLHYMPVKIVVAAVVLLWNYFARRVLIFDKK